MTLKNYFVGAGMDFNPTLPYLVVSNLEANKEYTFEVGSINREFNYWSKSLHIDTSPLICSINQWTGVYMLWTSAIKELKAMVNCLKTF